MQLQLYFLYLFCLLQNNTLLLVIHSSTLGEKNFEVRYVQIHTGLCGFINDESQTDATLSAHILSYCDLLVLFSHALHAS